MARRIRLNHHQLAAELSKRGISQNRWAQMLGIGRAHLSLLVNGKRPYPSAETRRKLLEGLGVPFSTLFEIEDERLQGGRPGWMPAMRTRREGSGVIDRLRQDLVFSVRSLAARPLLSVVVIAVLSLAIGANAATFSWVRGLLLRPLLVEEPDRFVSLGLRQSSGFVTSYSYPDYLDMAEMSRESAALFAQAFAQVSITVGRDNQRALADLVSAPYFDVLGTAPQLGRAFGAEEDRVPGRDAVIVLSHGFWQRQLQGDPDVVGREILINGLAYTVVGVMPENFGFTRVEPAFDLWVPLAMQEQIRPGTSTVSSRGSQFLQVYGRLHEGVAPQAGQEALLAAHAALGEQRPGEFENVSLQVLPAAEGFFGRAAGAVTGMMSVLMALVGGVLLIACSNAAGLLLARSVERSHEVGVRQALGAGRRRLAQQFLTESLLLSSLAGLLGVGIAYALNGLLLALQPPLPFAMRIGIGIDGPVLGFLAAVAVATGLVFGTMPALRAARQDVVGSLRGAGRVSDAGKLRSFLVAAQVAISLALLISAGFFLRSMQRAAAIDPGFETEGLVLAALDPSLQGYDGAEILEFYRQLSERMAAVPGVEGVGLAEMVPMGIGSQQWGAEVEGYEAAADERMSLDYNIVGPDYFRTLGVDLLAGREFAWTDDVDAPPVLMVNSTAAERFWPGGNALGGRVRLGSTWREVIGVVRDTKIYSLGEAPVTYIYLPMTQSSQGAMVLHVRAAGPMEGTVASIRDTVRALDSALPLFDLRSMTAQLSVALFPPRIAALVLGGFGAFALALAAVGLYGSLAYSVARRSREIGIRMALGAQTGSVVRLVARRVAMLAGGGMVVGLLLGAAIGRAAASLLYGVGWLDPAAMLGALAILLAVVATAAAVPALRATRVDPAEALRAE